MKDVQDDVVQETQGKVISKINYKYYMNLFKLSGPVSVAAFR